MTAPIGPSSQYATAAPLFDRVKMDSANLSASTDDIPRLRSYALYEDMYYNRPETFKVFLRGDHEDTDPVYIPSAKKIIEAMNRFLCKGYTFVVPPTGDDENERELILRIGNLFKRERFMSKFSNQKRFGLIRGDAMWYITADPNKPRFSRLSIHEMTPANYFPIKDPNDSKKTIGCHIVEVVQDPREDDKPKTIARRQTYLKAGVEYVAGRGQYEVTDSSAIGITFEKSHWTIGKWDDRNLASDGLERVSLPDLDVERMTLPERITSLPIYHWRNNAIPGSIFGISEISGIETLITGVNQTMTDEALSILMAGLGVYMTDSRPPQNSDGTTGSWQIGPAGVIEVPQGKKFERVSGVASIEPSQGHISKMQEGMQESSGIPDIAAGKVDVQVAESGISLALQLAPILAAAGEKEQEILGVMDQFLYDLMTMWFPAYEETDFGDSVTIYSEVEDAMPVNREAKVQEVLLVFTSGLITIAQAQAELAKLGYEFQKDDDLQVLKDQAALAAAKNGNSNRSAEDRETKPRELIDNAGKLPDSFSETSTQQPSPTPGTSVPSTIEV